MTHAPVEIGDLRVSPSSRSVSPRRERTRRPSPQSSVIPTPTSRSGVSLGRRSLTRRSSGLRPDCCVFPLTCVMFRSKWIVTHSPHNVARTRYASLAVLFAEKCVGRDLNRSQTVRACGLPPVGRSELRLAGFKSRRHAFSNLKGSDTASWSLASLKLEKCVGRDLNPGYDRGRVM